MPTVSVVLPAYNAASFVREAIDDLLTQTLSDIEVIVVDDGSTDATSEILASYTDSRLTVIDQSNRGIVSALATGIAASTAALIARADADDRYLPDRLARQADFLAAHPEVVLVASDFIRFYEGGRQEHHRVPTDHDGLLAALARTNPIMHASVMMRRDALAAAGGYSPEWQDIEDLELWFRLASVGKLASIPEVLARMRMHGASVTPNRQLRQARLETRLRLRLIRERQVPLTAARHIVRPMLKGMLPDRALPMYRTLRRRHQT